MDQQRFDANVDPNSTELSPIREYWWPIVGFDRWLVYARLQELDVDCRCQAGQPLQVRIESPQDLVSCWSVMRHVASSVGDRQALIAMLEHCLHLEVRS